MAKLLYHTLQFMCGSRKVFENYFGNARISTSIDRMKIAGISVIFAEEGILRALKLLP